MRAFISLNLCEETVSVLKEIQKSVKEELGNTDSKNVRWEASDKFHVTLFFIGEIEDERIEDLKLSLKNIKDEHIGVLSLGLRKLSGFPDMNRPRVLFVEVFDLENKLNKLNGIINKIMKDISVEQGSKFHAHITLGRIKKDCKIKRLTNLNIQHNFDIKDLHLMKSTLNRDGAVHESLFSAEL